MGCRPKRRWLRRIAIGCGGLIALVLLIAVWLGLQVREMTAPIALDGVHPFKSSTKKERYLAHYDARAARWPVPSGEVGVDTSWGRTFVRVSGPVGGAPLVLLPGANATGLMFQPNVGAWSEEFRVYAVDNIYDFGRSVYSRRPEQPGDFVDWLDELLDGLELQAGVNLLGMSYGGWIAAEYGLARPDRLQSVILAAPAATVAWFSEDFVKLGLSCIIPHPYFIKRMVRWALHDAAAGSPTERGVVADMAENAWLGLRCFKLRQLVGPRVLSDEEWRAFEIPVLLMIGENEVIYDLTGAEAIARVNRVAPGIETELFSGCGHDLTIVRPERFNRTVLDFLENPRSTPTIEPPV
jgi:pimeloyl-ACP methyl ester carboxylesterase